MSTLQSGTVTVLRPDMIDYETTSQFDLIVTATDLVLPVNERRQVSEMYVPAYNVYGSLWLRNLGLHYIDC